MKGEKRMAKPFKLCILFGDAPDRPPAEIAPGWEMAEIPVALQVAPFESHANWARRQAEIASWNLPPIKVSSHFIQHWGLVATGPGVDWEQLAFWTGRAFARLAQVGVEVVGIYGGFFRVPQGFSRTRAMDQGMRFVNMLADHAERHHMLVALEPMADLDTLWPRYLDGVAFAQEIGRPQVRVMADLAYFVRLDQPLEDIARDSEYCVHCHIAGEHGQPGIGDRVEVHTRLFRILRDIGYQRGVSAACPWVSSGGGPLQFGLETAKTLRYLRDLRNKVYTE
jgi:sugar phosphate isomerase/epimerase